MYPIYKKHLLFLLLVSSFTIKAMTPERILPIISKVPTSVVNAKKIIKITEIITTNPNSLEIIFDTAQRPETSDLDRLLIQTNDLLKQGLVKAAEKSWLICKIMIDHPIATGVVTLASMGCIGYILWRKIFSATPNKNSKYLPSGGESKSDNDSINPIDRFMHERALHEIFSGSDSDSGIMYPHHQEHDKLLSHFMLSSPDISDLDAEFEIHPAFRMTIREVLSDGSDYDGPALDIPSSSDEDEPKSDIEDQGRCLIQ